MNSSICFSWLRKAFGSLFGFLLLVVITVIVTLARAIITIAIFRVTVIFGFLFLVVLIFNFLIYLFFCFFRFCRDTHSFSIRVINLVKLSWLISKLVNVFAAKSSIFTAGWACWITAIEASRRGWWTYATKFISCLSGEFSFLLKLFRVSKKLAKSPWFITN